MHGLARPGMNTTENTTCVYDTRHWAKLQNCWAGNCIGSSTLFASFNLMCCVLITLFQFPHTTQQENMRVRLDSLLIGSLNAQINANLCNFLVQKCSSTTQKKSSKIWNHFLSLQRNIRVLNHCTNNCMIIKIIFHLPLHNCMCNFLPTREKLWSQLEFVMAKSNRSLPDSSILQSFSQSESHRQSSRKHLAKLNTHECVYATWDRQKCCPNRM